MKRFLLALFFLAAPLAATEYHVTTTGTGTACSLGTPCTLWTTWQPSIKTLSPGDIVWIHGGVYSLAKGGSGGAPASPGTLCWKNRQQGSAGNLITYRNWNREKVELDMNTQDWYGSPCGSSIGDYPNSSGNAYLRFWGLRLISSATNFSRFASGTGCTNCPFMDPVIAGKGSQWINMQTFDGINGLLKNPGNSGLYGGANLVRGSFSQYAGFVAATRGAGHSWYIKNPDTDGEAGRSYFDGNVGLRPFDIGLQTSGDKQSYETITNHVEAATGWDFANVTWPALSAERPFYLGSATSTINTECHIPGSSAVYKQVFDNNVAIGGTGLVIASTRGGCDITITNNDFVMTGGQTTSCSHKKVPTPPAVCNPPGSCCPDDVAGCGIYPPFIFSGNTLYTPLNGGGCPIPPLTLANYPNNTVLAGIPTSGADSIKYWASPDEAGFGWALVRNWDSSANATIDLAQMGGFANQKYVVMNWQDNDPWSSTPIASGTCPGGGCGSISVTTTCSGSCVIRRPAMSMADGVTPFVKPPDLGPKYVLYYLYVDPAASGTPTPTFTPSLTPTFTRTPTLTPSPTLTFTPTNTVVPPTNTFTPSPTVTATPTFTVTRTPTPTATPSAGSSASFAFSDPSFCTVTAPMAVSSDPSVFPGSYVTSAVGNNGKVVCTFTVPSSTLYRVWLKTYGSSSAHDSVFIDYDGNYVADNCLVDGNTTCSHIFDTQEQSQPCSGEQSCEYKNSWDQAWWNPLNDRTATCGSCSGLYTERQLTLAAGTHTISFRMRDADTRLYYAIITSDTSFVPVDPSPTPTPAPRPRLCRCNGKWGFISGATSFFGPCSPCPF